MAIVQSCDMGQEAGANLQDWTSNRLIYSILIVYKKDENTELKMGYTDFLFVLGDKRRGCHTLLFFENAVK